MHFEVIGLSTIHFYLHFLVRSCAYEISVLNFYLA
jgi:hypothetical protein